MGAVGLAARIRLHQTIVETDRMARARDRLTAHGMARGTDIDRAAIAGSLGDFRADRGDECLAGVLRQGDVAVDRRARQAAGIVEEPGLCRHIQPGRALIDRQVRSELPRADPARRTARPHQQPVSCHFAHMALALPR